MDLRLNVHKITSFVISNSKILGYSCFVKRVSTFFTQSKPIAYASLHICSLQLFCDSLKPIAFLNYIFISYYRSLFIHFINPLKYKISLTELLLYPIYVDTKFITRRRLKPVASTDYRSLW